LSQVPCHFLAMTAASGRGSGSAASIGFFGSTASMTPTIMPSPACRGPPSFNQRPFLPDRPRKRGTSGGDAGAAAARPDAEDLGAVPLPAAAAGQLYAAGAGAGSGAGSGLVTVDLVTDTTPAVRASSAACPAVSLAAKPLNV
jgi:hypothetical protein